MTLGEQIRKLTKEQQPYMVAMRRRFHEWPEIAGREEKTRNVLIAEAEKMGLPYELLPGTGLIIRIEGEEQGKHVVLRADMDGLPVTEDRENLKGEKACVSQVAGMSHACGHDAHMAMLLGAMKVLVQMKDQIRGTIYCCFEEGEEINCGYEAMLTALEKYSIDTCFALHVYNGLEAGKISLEEGARMAGTARIGLKFLGKGGHGSRPDLAVNPLIPAAHFITNLNSAFVNQMPAGETVTLGITCVQGGNTDNVIPESVYVAGTSRFFKKELGEKAVQIVRQMAKGICACHNCTVEFMEQSGVTLDPAVNDGACCKVAAAALTAAGYGNAIAACPAWYASDCYEKYLQRYPGIMGFLGIQNETTGAGAGHHNGKFDVDESVMTLGATSEVAYVMAWCGTAC